MENNIAIKNLNLNIGKKEISLTLEEARKLQEVLNDLFKTKEVVVKEVHHHKTNWFESYRPYFYGTQTITSPSKDLNDLVYRPLKVVCSGDTSLSYTAALLQANNTLKVEI